MMVSSSSRPHVSRGAIGPGLLRPGASSSSATPAVPMPMSPIDKPLPSPPVHDLGSAKSSSELDVRSSLPSPLSTIAEDSTPSSTGKAKDKGRARWKGKAKARGESLPLQSAGMGLAGFSGSLLTPDLTPTPTVPVSTPTAAAPLPSPITNLPTPTTTASATTPLDVDRGLPATVRKHNTTAQMYFIFGVRPLPVLLHPDLILTVLCIAQLPKAPSMWSMTEDDSNQGTTHAEGALNRF